MSTLLREAVAVPAGSGSRRKITIISEGWGSSGYYSRELLARDGPRIFPAGTHMYLDHPTATEEMERPERSVRDLAARIATTPYMEGPDLVAEAVIFPHWAPVIDALADDIGVSIRARGEAREGEAEGRTGPIITSLDEGLSVDFVTRAGRGGRIGNLIESARRSPGPLEEARNAGHWLESRIHRDFTIMVDDLFGQGYLTRAERISLSHAIGDALTAFSASVEANLPDLYRRDPYTGPPEEQEGTNTEVTEQEDRVNEAERIKTLEAQVAELTRKLDESEQRASDAVTRAERAEDALLRIRARETVLEALKDDSLSTLPERAHERVVKEALSSKLPMTESGRLDEDILKERAVKAAQAELDYLRESMGGDGVVRGFGSGETFSESGSSASNGSAERKLVESFMSLGMDESTAKIAAGGR